MKLGIMQPYFFPYIGYFQLINAVDTFVIHDDVQWIKNGWINRNRILVNGEDRFITLPLQKDSSLLDINQRCLSADIDAQKEKIGRQVRESYRKAPQFDAVFALFERCMACPERNIALFTTHAIRACCDYLGITTPIVFSSALQKDNTLRAQERVIAINRALDAHHYINPSGGMELYDRDAFAQAGIMLQFLKTRAISYPQLGHPHVPFLSMLDVMMFNTPAQLTLLLQEYDLL